MSSIAKKSGVYEIRNLLNGDIYIGSSVDIYKRIYGHVNLLNKDKHHNKHLQSAWSKYGGDSFLFNVIEECEGEREILLAREQYYIDVLFPRYNIRKDAFSRLGSSCSEETKRKLSALNSGKVLY